MRTRIQIKFNFHLGSRDHTNDSSILRGFQGLLS